jgi:hypothetical protein
MMMPPEQLDEEKWLMNINLTAAKKKEVTMGELLKFYGVYILVSRGRPRARRDLWEGESASKYVKQAQDFSRTGMTRHRFEEMLSAWEFSDAPNEKPDGMPYLKYAWLKLDVFIKRFNKHMVTKYHSTEQLCIDKSFSRWYGLGGSWVTFQWTESQNEIQTCCDAKMGIMLSLKLVKGNAGESASEETSNDEVPHGSKVMLKLLEDLSK